MHRFKYGGFNLKYEKYGNRGPMIFMIHGLGASGCFWKKLKKYFEDDYQVYVWDLLGFGDSDRVRDDRFYTLDFQSEIVSAFIKEKRLKEVILVGHSFGGLVAMKVFNDLRRKEKKIVSKRLVVIGSPFFPDYLPATVKLAKYFLGSIFFNNRFTLKWSSRKIYEKLFYDKKRAGKKIFDRFWVDFRRSGSELVWRATMKNFVSKLTFRLMDDFNNLQGDALILWGEFDELVPLPIAGRMKEKIKHCQFSLIKSSGHNCPLERPSEISKEIKKFIEN